jgi:hypothetical protein
LVSRITNSILKNFQRWEVCLNKVYINFINGKHY